MQRILNALDPGKEHDNRVMYGTGEEDASRGANVTGTADQTFGSASSTSAANTSGLNEGKTTLNQPSRLAESDNRTFSETSIKSGVPGNPQDLKKTAGPAAITSENTVEPTASTTGTSSRTYNSKPAESATFVESSRLAGKDDLGRGERNYQSTTAGTYDSQLSNTAYPGSRANYGNSCDGAAVGGAAGKNTLDQSGGKGDIGARNTGGSVGTQAAHGPEAWVGAHDHLGRGHEYAGDPCPPDAKKHTTMTANLLDPNIAGYDEPGWNDTKGETAGYSGNDQVPISSGANAPGTAASGIFGTTAARGQNRSEGPVTSKPVADNRTGLKSSAGRDTAGADALGTAAYEAEKRHQQKPLETTNRETGSASHPGQDVPLAGGTGAAAYETEKHQQQKTYDTTSREPGSHIGRDAAVLGGAGATAYEAEKHHNSKNDPAYGDKDAASKSHTGRDAALTGGTGAAAYEAEKAHHNKTTGAAASQPVQGAHTTRDQAKTSPYATGAADPRIDRKPKDQHYARDGAAAGGTTAVADHEVSKHEAKKEAKEQAKYDKHEAKHDKHTSKEDKHAEKEKKHHGLFSFLHRDKSKKETAQEEKELSREEHQYDTKPKTNAVADSRASTEGTTATSDTVGTESRGDRNRLHKDPPAKLLETLPGNTEGDLSSTGEGEKRTVTEPQTGLPMHLHEGSTVGDAKGNLSGYSASGEDKE